jgi:tRNA G10  N-methylase Trm11
VDVLACIPVSRADHLAQRPPTCEEDHFPESLAQAMIEAFSRPGDVVLDPFAGYGTTARVATRLGRQSIAVELLEQRAAHIRDTTSDVVVLSGDARTLRTLVPEPVDLCLTSPPYMPSVGHPENAGHVTPLAFDVAARISCRLTFRGHIAICWDERPPGILSDHCLVFGAT